MVQGSKSPKPGKEGFGVKKLPLASAPERKIPISLQGSTRKMGIFWLKAPISGALGNGSFFFPILAILAPVGGGQFRKGRGCDEELFSEKKGFLSVTRGEAIQWIRGLVRISTGKATQWRGLGHSLNRRTLKTEKLLSSSPSRKSALIDGRSKEGYWGRSKRDHGK